MNNLFKILLSIIFTGVLISCKNEKINTIDNSQVIFSTYYGDIGTDDADVLAVDTLGNIYLGCHSDSKKLPASSEFPYKLSGGMDALIVKLNSDGKTVGYITQVGGKDWDAVQGIVSDAERNIYAVGTTYSSDFPISNNSFQKEFGGESDAFVVKLNPKGDVIWSILLGGSADEDGRDIVIDSNNTIHIVGRTASENFPTTTDRALQPESAGGIDAFITSIDLDGNVLNSSYIGGSGNDIGFAINTNPNGQLLIAGTTNSHDFPVKNAVQNKINGDNDIFITAINQNNPGIEFSSYLGGSNSDQLYGMGVDSLGKVIITGVTSSTNFPVTEGAFQQSIGGGTDIFISKFDLEKPSMMYSTYLGGNKDDSPRSLTVSSNGNTYIVGKTNSDNYPNKNAIGNRSGESDAIVTVLNKNGSKLLYSTLYGGNAIETFEGIALGTDSSVTVSGLSNSTNFPVKNAIQDKFKGGRFDIVISRFKLTKE